MRYVCLGLGLLLAACGGSVDNGKSSSGSGATGGVAAGGGSGGSTSTGGSTHSGGSSGTGGFGGTGGSGGTGVQSCCTGDGACYTGMGGGAGAAPPMECVENACKPVPPSMSCWTDKDCPFGLCVGALPCPCGSFCKTEQMGQCLAPPDSGCCNSDADCANASNPPGTVCVSGNCMQPVADGCWSDAQCPPGQTCVGAGVCPCQYSCAISDVPGKCQ